MYNLSRSYGLARTFVSDVCQQTSLNLLSVTHFQEAQEFFARYFLNTNFSFDIIGTSYNGAAQAAIR